MVTERRKHELQRKADKKALATVEKVAKKRLKAIEAHRKDIANLKATIKRRIAAEKAKKAILSKKRRKR